jgi:hypothetical protein
MDDGFSLLIDLFKDIFIGTASDEIREILRKMMEGQDISTIFDGGGDTASAFMDAFQLADINPATMNGQDWNNLAELMVTTVKG